MIVWMCGGKEKIRIYLENEANLRIFSVGDWSMVRDLRRRQWDKEVELLF